MSAIYQTAARLSDGVPVVGGFWTLKTRHGFPLDMSYEMAKERGWLIDWCEVLLDAGRVPLPAWEWDTAMGEIRMLVPEDADEIERRFKEMGARAVRESEGLDFAQLCQLLWEQKRAEAHLAEEARKA